MNKTARQKAIDTEAHKMIDRLSMPIWIETETMKLWFHQGTIWETSRGEENIYFENEFGMKFFCKCL